jgi:hypothetical protein
MHIYIMSSRLYKIVHFFSVQIYNYKLILDIQSLNHHELSFPRKFPIFGLVLPLSTLNLQKSENHHKLYKSHVIKF